MNSDVFVMNSSLLMAGFHAECLGMLGDAYNRDKEPVVAVPCIKIDFSLAIYGRV